MAVEATEDGVGFSAYCMWWLARTVWCALVYTGASPDPMVAWRRQIEQRRHLDCDVEVACEGFAWRARNPELGASIDDGWDLVALHKGEVGLGWPQAWRRGHEFPWKGAIRASSSRFQLRFRGFFEQARHRWGLGLVEVTSSHEVVAENGPNHCRQWVGKENQKREGRGRDEREKERKKKKERGSGLFGFENSNIYL